MPGRRNLEDSERDVGVNPMRETDAPSDRRALKRRQIEVFLGVCT